MNKLSIKHSAKYIRSDSLFTVGAKISEKSISCTWIKPWVTNLALNLATKPLGWYLTLNTNFNPIAFRPEGSLLYSHIWWFLRFYNSVSMTSFYQRPWIKSLMTWSYDDGLHILLLHSVINITVSSCLLGTYSATVGLSSFNDIVMSIKTIFWSRLLGLGSSAGAFFFSEGVLFNGHLASNFTPFSDLSMYGLLVMTICFVWGAQIRKCFNVSELYPMRILFQTLWWSDFTLFSSGIL